MEHPAPTPEERLRAAGLRATAPRVAVLDWVGDHPHATADEVGTAVRARLGTISRQTVYDVLSACVGAGLVRQIRPAGHPARFETRTGDNHHHIVCRACGRVEDDDCTVATRPCLDPDDDRGFTVDEAELVFWGMCPDCHATDRVETEPLAVAD